MTSTIGTLASGSRSDLGEVLPALGASARRPVELPEGKVPLRALFVQFAVRERYFLMILGLAFLLVGATYQTPHVAMWIGFAFAGYAAVANDSIQTIGTFIASNRGKPWWLLWAWIGGIFLVTVTYSWVAYGGDVSYGRLMAKGFERAPSEFAFLQVAAPLFLIIITRLRMPVSTTMLLLSCFATSGKGIGDVLLKSVSGYVIAFAAAAALWLTLGKLMQRRFVGEAHPAWRSGQWITTGLLWSVWLMQDAANIAVFLPRALSGLEFVAFALVIFAGLGFLFAMGGEKIQEVVDEKSDVVDVRMATVIDLLYTAIMFWFKEVNPVPMSTTWVFIGLLGGRELAMHLTRSASTPRTGAEVRRLILRDVGYAAAGLAISLALAASINESVRAALFG